MRLMNSSCSGSSSVDYLRLGVACLLTPHDLLGITSYPHS